MPRSIEPIESDPAATPSRRRFHATALVVVAGAGLAGCQSPGRSAGIGAARAASAASGDWMEIVRTQHRAVDALFAKLVATQDPATRATLRSALADALTVHSVQEENVLYPALAMAGLRAEPQQLYAEQAQMKVLLAELDVLPNDHPNWGARVQNLRAIVQKHVADEEERIYPAFRAALTADQNVIVTARYRGEGEKFRVT